MQYNIAVVGCGVIGLTTATAIQKEFKNKRPCKVTIFTEKISPYTTGDVSAGVWGPYLYQETDINDIIRWSKQTYHYLIKLWREGHAEEAGICLQVMTMVFKSFNPEDIEWLSVPFGCERLSEKHIEKINQQCKKDYRSGFNFLTISSEPLRLLPFLQKRFVQNGGEIKIKKVADFSELSDYDVIVNCTGLYSKILANDDHVTPVRGQLVRVKAPWNFQTFADKDGGGHVVANYDTIVLGGTSQMNDDREKPSEEDTQMILQKCYELVPALKKTKIENVTVGLRPVRTNVRLEVESKIYGKEVVQIVHNYGHGGSGVTLAYGCALDAVELVKQALSYKHKL